MIEKTYDTYHSLLTNFLDGFLIKDRFTKELEKYRGIDIPTYINKILLSKTLDIESALSMAFIFDKTRNGADFWKTMDKAWKNFLKSYYARKNTLFKSIW